MAHYIHSVPGRLRIRTRQVKGNKPVAAVLSSHLGDAPGVHRVEANVVTGSITIRYDHSQTGPDALIARIREIVAIDVSATGPRADDTLAQEAMTRAGHRVARYATGVIIEKVIERSAVALIGALV